LRLHELAVIKSDPKRILAAGTDWHFPDELKRDLKGVRLTSGGPNGGGTVSASGTLEAPAQTT
jgi:hypothetical protein